MRNHLTRMAAAAILAACAAIPLGCEKAETRADQETMKSLAEVDRLRESSSDPIAAARKLAEVANRAEIGDAARAAAKAALGAARYDQAMALLSQRGAEDGSGQGLVQKEQAALVTIGQIESLTAQIAANNLDVAALTDNSPKRAPKDSEAPLDQLDKQKKEHEAQSAAAAAKIKEAQGKIDALNGEIKQLQEKIAASTRQATDLIDKSEHAKGEEAVKLYNQGLDLRKQAAEAAFQVTQRQFDVRNQQVIVDEQTAQKGIWDAAAAADQKMIDGLNAAWTASRDAAKARTSESQALLSDKGIADRARELDRLMKEAAATRTQVMDLLKQSDEAYRQAWDSARKINQEMTQRMSGVGASKSPSYEAWRRMQDLTSQSQYSMGQARAWLAVGMLSVEERGILQAQRLMIQNLSAALAPAKLTMPPELNASQVAARIDELTKSARDAFVKADQLTGASETDVVDTSSPDRYTASGIHLLAQYGLAATEGTGPKATEALNRARKQLKVMSGKDQNGLGLLMPKWPDEVESGVVDRAAPSIPSTRPAPRPAPTDVEKSSAPDASSTPPTNTGTTETPAPQRGRRGRPAPTGDENK